MCGLSPRVRQLALGRCLRYRFAATLIELYLHANWRFRYMDPLSQAALTASGGAETAEIGSINVETGPSSNICTHHARTQTIQKLGISECDHRRS